MNIRFTWAGKKYKVGMEAYDSAECIVLPDSTAVRPTMWLESYPPIPDGLEEVPHLFKNCDAQTAATHLNGVVAHEDTQYSPD